MLGEKNIVFNKIRDHYYVDIENSINKGKLNKKLVGKQLVYQTSKSIWTPGDEWDYEGRIDARGKNSLELSENLARKVMDIIYPKNKKSKKEITNITFGEVCNDWLNNYMPYRKNKSTGKVIQNCTRQDYMFYGNKLIESNFGKEPISKITIDDINNYISTNLKNYTKTPYKYTKTIITKTFSLAKKYGYITEVPFSNMEFDEFSAILEPEFKEYKSKNILYEEYFEVFSKASAHLIGGIMIPTFLYTGIRPSELIRLKWEDFDFENCCLNISRERTKTKSGERFIPLPQWIANELNEEHKNALEYEKQHSSECETIFHVKMDYSLPYDKNTLRYFWHDLLDEVDIISGAIVYRNQIVYSNFDYSNSNITSNNKTLHTYHVNKSLKNKNEFDLIYPHIGVSFKSKMIPYITPDCTRHTFKSYGSVEMPDIIMRKVFGHTTGTADDYYEHQINKETRKNMESFYNWLDELFGNVYREERKITNSFFKTVFNNFLNQNKREYNCPIQCAVGTKAIYFRDGKKEYKLRINSMTQHNKVIRFQLTLFNGFNDYRKSAIESIIVLVKISEVENYKDFIQQEYT